MSKVLPERVDIARLADTRASLSGSLPVARFSRLAPQLAGTAGEVSVALGFEREDGREVIRGRIEGELALVCQRCLGAVTVAVVADVDLVRVASDADAEQVDGRHEPFVAATREVELATLVEDELILAVPLVPLHDAGGPCRPATTTDEPSTRENPFAALASMRKPPHLKKN